MAKTIRGFFVPAVVMLVMLAATGCSNKQRDAVDSHSTATGQAANTPRESVTRDQAK